MGNERRNPNAQREGINTYPHRAVMGAIRWPWVIVPLHLRIEKKYMAFEPNTQIKYIIGKIQRN